MTINDVDYNQYFTWFPWGLTGYVMFMVGFWPVLRKAGIAGWGALIPLYNLYLLVKVSGWRGWSLVLFVVPVVNILAAIILCRDLGRAFGTGLLFKICLILFFPLAILVLGFGHWRFIGRLTVSLAR